MNSQIIRSLSVSIKTIVYFFLFGSCNVFSSALFYPYFSAAHFLINFLLNHRASFKEKAFSVFNFKAAFFEKQNNPLQVTARIFSYQ
jgi:hypothetical protein